MNSLINILLELGAIEEGHYIYTSGRHGSIYIRKDKIYPQVHLVSKLSRKIARMHSHLEVDVVVGPSMGGVILSSWVAYHLSKINKRNVLSVFTEKYINPNTKEESQIFKRGYDKIVSGKNVLIVEDVVNTGKSIFSVLTSVKKAQANIVGITSLVNRSPNIVKMDTFGFTYTPLCEYDVSSFESSECPLCADNIPINLEVGHKLILN